jgi:hypothetical protein
MKITAAMIAFAMTASQLCADDPPFVKELEQLQKQRDKDITAAIEPINRRYQASLDQLGRKATQANALDAALKIRQASEQISNRFPQAAGTEIVGNHNTRQRMGEGYGIQGRRHSRGVMGWSGRNLGND